ncbi:Cthe_2314 family HEPN domain-containing protein [Aeromonas enteropelogenes]|uniref:Cthe_2314 family HEPN domain-containing protein n=1 Tax=Aeromonas enteropelogenes TaxID=29489 RepID=UPI003F749DED
MTHQIFESFLRDLETHRNDSEKTEIEQYHADCWSTCKAVKTSLKKLEIAEECIRKSYQFSPSEHEIAEYIEFHIENYLIRSRSVYDRVLIFTNYLCDIQMARDAINHISIITNQKVEKLGLHNALKKINKVCAVYRLERNSVVHHDRYSDQRLEWVSTARKAKFIMSGDIKSIGLSDEVIDQNTAAVIIEHLDRFSESTGKITESVNRFLDLALPVYEARTKKT